MSGAAAGLDEVEAKNWPALYELCDARLRKVQASGGEMCIRDSYFIDLDALKEEGLLTAAQLKASRSMK